MRPLFYFFVIFIVAFSSCNWQNRETTQETLTFQDGNISLVGNWYQFSTENGYSEFEIDSQYVVVFSEKLGRSKLEYKIENDSFKYVTIDYSAKIIPESDSTIVLRGKHNTATLIKMDETNDVFESIPSENNSALFNAYLKKFSERAAYEWSKAGFTKN